MNKTKPFVFVVLAVFMALLTVSSAISAPIRPYTPFTGPIMPRVVLQPDFDIEVTATPTSLETGETVTFEVTVVNRGPVAANVTYVHDFGDGSTGDSKPYTLSYRESFTEIVRHSYRSAGTYTYTFTADPEDDVDEYNEANNVATGTVEVSDPRMTACADSVDNDRDGLVDRHDPGCYNSRGMYDPTDDDETNAPWEMPKCHDGRDNDGDGLVDFPDDPGCVALDDDDETDPPLTRPVCNDGLDNDGDGLTDKWDPGCAIAPYDDEGAEGVETCELFIQDVDVHPAPLMAGDLLTADVELYADCGTAQEAITRAYISELGVESGTTTVMVNAHDTTLTHVSLRIPSDTPDGDYELTAETEFAGGTVTSVGIITVESLPPAGDADIVIEAPVVTPAEIVRGEAFTVTYNVQNEGDADIADEFFVDVMACDPTYTSCHIYDTVTVSGLGAGAAVSETTSSITLLGTDYHDAVYLRIMADSYSDVPESDETNNYHDLRVETLEPVVPGFGLPPVAMLNVDPTEGESPLLVTLSGADSYDPDGTVERYTWVVTGPGGYTWSQLDMAGAPGAVVPPAMVDAGVYDVMLIVSDNEGLVGEPATASVTVTEPGIPPVPGGNQAPVPVVTFSPDCGDEPFDVTFDISGSYDPDGTITAWAMNVYSRDFADWHLAYEGIWGIPVTFDPITWELYNGPYHIEFAVEDDMGVSTLYEAEVMFDSCPVADPDPDPSTDPDPDPSTDPDPDPSTDPDPDPSTDPDPDDESIDISHVDVEDITEDSAVIKWETNLEADSYIEWGEEEDDLDDDDSDNDLVYDHEFELEDLEPNTRYYYVVKSCTDSGACDEEGPFRFNTLDDGSDDGSDSGSDDSWDDTWSDGYDDDWSDMYNTNAALLDSGATTGSAAVTMNNAQPEQVIEVVYAPVQYMKVEKEVCSFRFLWWCLWKEYVMEKVPIPALKGGVQFVV